MDRIQRSWELFKSSLTVMQTNKTLLVFPILTAVLSIALVVLFLVPVAFQRTGYSYDSSQHWKAVANTLCDVNAINNAKNSSSADAADGSSPNNRNVMLKGVKPLAVGYFALMYFSTMFLATFLNVAFYRAILNALRGEPASIGDGLMFAASKWKAILLWTAFAGIVGYIIKSIEERSGWLGSIIMSILGAVWSVACVFVIPVIITEEETSNPITILKKSALTLKQTWGESLIGYVGVSLGGSIIMLGSLLWLGIGLGIAAALHSVLIAVIAGVSWFIGISLLSYLMSVASQIFRCALFLYATEGTLPAPYTDDMAAMAWRVKKS